MKAELSKFCIFWTNLQYRKIFSFKAMGAILIFAAWLGQNFFEANYRQQLEKIDGYLPAYIHGSSVAKSYLSLLNQNSLGVDKNKSNGVKSLNLRFSPAELIHGECFFSPF